MGAFSKPKAPAKTAEQAATELRTRSLLDKEIEETEDRFKLLASGKLGRKSILSGSPRSAADAAGSGARSSLLPTSRTASNITANQPQRVGR